MKALRHVANEVKPDFWLMGEVIHGDYTRWVNEGTLHSVTNYNLHKALYSGHNDHNYFEIAHTVKRLYEMGGSRPDGLKLYNFVDNHDVERIYTKLNNKAHFAPVHILLYTLPGVPSIYYGSEFGIEGRKERFSDDSLRPALSLSDYAGAVTDNPHTRLIAALGKIRQNTPALSYGNYQELLLTNRQYAYSRNHNGQSVIVTVNNDDSDYVMTLRAGNAAEYIGALSGEKVSVNGGNIVVNVRADSGDIWLPVTPDTEKAVSPVPSVTAEPAPAPQSAPAAATTADQSNTAARTSDAQTAATASTAAQSQNISSVSTDAQNQNTSSAATDAQNQNTSSASTAAHNQDAAASHSAPSSNSQKDAPVSQDFENGRIAGLQEAILAIMEKNGPVTDQMRRDVEANVYHDSLITWIKSFR